MFHDLRFLRQYKRELNEFHYFVNTPADLDPAALREAMIKTLNTCETLSDMCSCILSIRYITRHLKKFLKKLVKHQQAWNELPYAEDDRTLSLIPEDEAFAVCITDALSGSHKKIWFTSTLYDNEIWRFTYAKGRYSLRFSDAESPYSTKFSRWSATEMKIMDKNDDIVCIVALTDDNNLILKKNRTAIELVPGPDGNGTGIFPKKYCRNVKDGENYDPEQLIAMFDWDLLKKNSNLSVSRVEIYKDVDTETMVLIYLLALTNFILFQRYVEQNQSMSLAASGMPYLFFRH